MTAPFFPRLAAFVALSAGAGYLLAVAADVFVRWLS